MKMGCGRRVIITPSSADPSSALGAYRSVEGIGVSWRVLGKRVRRQGLQAARLLAHTRLSGNSSVTCWPDTASEPLAKPKNFDCEHSDLL